MIDFSIPDDLRMKRDRIRQFVQSEIIPYESDPRLTQHGPNDALRQDMVEKARSAGLLSIQAGAGYGGWDINHVERAVLFEAAGWSTLGPVAMNCAAPDEGNMSLLEKVANESQSEIFLRPLVDGYARSVFAMTEPSGAGSDPSQLNTLAKFDGEILRSMAGSGSLLGPMERGLGSSWHACRTTLSFRQDRRSFSPMVEMMESSLSGL